MLIRLIRLQNSWVIASYLYMIIIYRPGYLFNRDHTSTLDLGAFPEALLYGATIFFEMRHEACLFPQGSNSAQNLTSIISRIDL
jgi:hypothetical protein